MNIDAIDVEEVVRRVCVRLEARAWRSGIEIDVFNPRREALPKVAADRERLEQVLMSFGLNAIEYNRLNGAVRVRISQPSPDRVRIAISDTGVGICSDQQARLFNDAVQQAPAAVEPVAGGLGMTKRWVEAMGGELAFWSQVGFGSTFWVDLPIHGP